MITGVITLTRLLIDLDLFIALQLKYRILSPYMLRDRQKEVVAQVADLLVISQNEAVRVLRHYKW